MSRKFFYNILKIVITTLSLLYIYKSSIGNFKIIFDKINLDYYLIICLIFIRFFQQLIASHRLFSLLKLISKYNSNFIEWSRIYFSTALVYLTPIIGAGHLMRAYEMKNRHFSYKEYVSLQFIIFSWGILIESALIFLICFFNKQIDNYILALFFIIMICFLPTVSKSIINILFGYIKKINVYNFLNKVKLNIDKTITITSNTINTKNFIVYSLYTLCLFCLEFLMYYLILSYVFIIIDIKIILLIFILNFFIRKIPLVNNIPGLKEVINGLFVQQLGFIFFEGVLFLITFRVLNLLSLIMNNLFFFLIKK